MKRKILAFLSALFFLCGLSACGRANGVTNTGATELKSRIADSFLGHESVIMEELEPEAEKVHGLSFTSGLRRCVFSCWKGIFPG